VNLGFSSKLSEILDELRLRKTAIDWIRTPVERYLLAPNLRKVSKKSANIIRKGNIGIAPAQEPVGDVRRSRSLPNRAPSGSGNGVPPYGMTLGRLQRGLEWELAAAKATTKGW
jgi:hypothetical protein